MTIVLDGSTRNLLDEWPRVDGERNFSGRKFYVPGAWSALPRSHFSCCRFLFLGNHPLVRAVGLDHAHLGNSRRGNISSVAIVG